MSESKGYELDRRLDEPFNHLPWIQEPQMSRSELDRGHIELLPAMRQQYPGCISDHVVSVRVEWSKSMAASDWQVLVNKFEHAEERLFEGCYCELKQLAFNERELQRLAQNGHRLEMESIHMFLEQIFSPGRALHVAETLGIFKVEAWRLLKETACSAASDAVEKAEDETDRVMSQGRHLLNWIVFSAEALCRNVDLATSAVESMRMTPARSFGYDEEVTLWDEILSEVRGQTLFNEVAKRQVLQAVYDSFKALPLATQWAYWLLNGRNEEALEPGGEWKETSANPEDWTMHDIETALEKAVRKVWAKADDDAYKEN